jgi:hypothetical protein
MATNKNMTFIKIANILMGFTVSLVESYILKILSCKENNLELFNR